MALIIDAPMPKGKCWWEENGVEHECHFFPCWGNADNCPIIGEIPDSHGDLIGRDKASTQIIAEICQFCASAENGNCDGCLVQKCLEAIGRAPIIVEATE